MPISILGDGSITGITSGGLPDGIVTNNDLATGISSSKLTGALPILDGSALTGVGVTGITSASSSGTAINIASDNKVGIGAVPANALLYITGAAGTNKSAIQAINTSTDGTGLYVNVNHASSDYYGIRVDNSAGKIFEIKGDGNVGIGAAPTSAVGFDRFLTIVGTNPSLGLKSSAAHWEIASLSNGNLRFVKDDVDKMLMLPNGRTGLGNSSPDARLDIIAASETGLNVKSTVAGETTAQFQGAGTGSVNVLRCHNTSGTELFRVLQNGRGLSQFTAKAWINFNGAGTVSIRDSHGVSTLADSGTGYYVISFSNDFGNANYSFQYCGGSSGGAETTFQLASTPGAGSNRVQLKNAAGTATDRDYITGLYFGD
jgi:hypothetical protein